MGDSPEKLLVARCRAGDEAAWAEVFRRHAPRVALFFRCTLGWRDVDDLVQRVFLEFLTSLPRYREEGSLSAWLHGIAHNLAHKELRTVVRRKGQLAELSSWVESAAVSLSGQVEAREALEQVAQALDTLNLRFRSVWVMREVEGMSVEEVAETLGETPATVRTRHHRAREKLLEAISRRERPGLLGFLRRGARV